MLRPCSNHVYQARPTPANAGAAQGAVNTPLVNVALGLVEDRHAGMAAGVVSTLQQVGAALGVAAAGMLFGGALQAHADASAPERYAHAFSAAMQFNVAAIAAAVLLLWWLGRRFSPPV